MAGNNNWILCVTIAVLALGCKDESPCGEGTVMENGKCVSVCGTGTVFQDGKCIAIAAAEEREGRDSVEEFSKIKDEMCQCTTKECAEGVNKKFEDWLKDNEKAKRGQQERAKAIAKDYTKCMMSAMASP